MVTAKERLEEIGRKHPIEKSINEHHKGVILSVIHNYMRVLSKNITEIKSDYRKIRLYEDTLKSYANQRINIKATRDKLAEIPACPD